MTKDTLYNQVSHIFIVNVLHIFFFKYPYLIIDSTLNEISCFNSLLTISLYFKRGLYVHKLSNTKSYSHANAIKNINLIELQKRKN